MEFQFKPYEGNEPYVFISYCRDDTPMCQKLVSYLGEKNIRAWYDNAIHVGDAWPEIIATRLKASHVCILLMTDGFVSSVNCNRELTYAVKNGVKLVPVRLDGTNITDGMDLMIGGIQYIKIRKDSAGECDLLSAFNKVLDNQLIKDCVGSYAVSVDLEKPVEEEPRAAVVVPKENFPPEEKPNKKGEIDTTAVSNFSPKNKFDVIVIYENIDEAYFLSSESFFVTAEGDRLSLAAERAEAPGLIFACANGKIWLENKGEDIYTNVGLLRKGEKAELVSDAIRLELGSQKITVLSGEAAQRVKKAGKLPMLYCPGTDEKCFILESEFRLGRKYLWRKGTMDDRYVSEENAVIFADKEEFAVKDVGSVNGTLHNGQFLEQGESQTLSNGDSIQAGGTFIKFSIVNIKELESNKS